MNVAVSVDLHGVREGDSEPELAAYAFTSGGQLLKQVPLKGGTAGLELPTRKEPQSVRVAVGPRDLRDEGELADLFRLNAPERTIALEPGATKVETSFAIPRPDWLCWLSGLCLVRGKLLKRVPSGGHSLDLPVCEAEVEIYEVDPLPKLVPQIPEDVLDRLRKLVQRRRPWPPKPRNIGDPGPIAEVERLLASAGVARSRPATAPGFGGAELPRPEGPEEMERTVRLASTPPEPPSAEDLFQSIAALSQSEPILIAANQSLSAFRKGLIDNADLTRPILCRLFPFVTKQLIAKTTTDHCGRFSSWYWRGCSNDTPDLYFVAYRRFNFFRVPIYEPLPVGCHTYWDYDCGSEVTLYTSSPFARTCPPCRPVIANSGWVSVAAIGRTALSRIHGTGAELSSTSADIGLTESGAPFGGTLRPRLEFDNALREELGVRYYRISWKKDGSSDPWINLDLAVNRHYSREIPGQPPVNEVYPLGPYVVGGEPSLFEIPPPLPPIAGSEWTEPDWKEDNANGKFQTGGCLPTDYGLVPPAAAGIYQLRVELFHDDGTPVDLVADGVHFVVPKSKNLSGTIETEEAAALGLVPGPPPGGGNAFVMRLHIDNNPTTAIIEPPLVNGSTSPEWKCGAIEYKRNHPGNITIPFIASHPHGFANYSFAFARGEDELEPPSSSGPVEGGFHASEEPVATLLDGCTIAAFAEELHVAGTATDGWDRLGYDAHDLRAFALKPREEP